MSWILIGVIVLYLGYRYYTRVPVQEDYVLKDLKPGDRIRILYGAGDETFKVIKNYPHLQKIVLKNSLLGRTVRHYNSYNFNDYKSLES